MSLYYLAVDTEDPLGGYKAVGSLLVFFEQEQPTGSVNGSNTEFILSSYPVNAKSTFVYLEGMIVNDSKYTLDLINRKITFNTPPVIGQDVYVQYSKTTSQFEQEVPIGTVDGVNTVFYTVGTPQAAKSVFVYLEGMIQNSITKYTLDILNSKITFTIPPAVGQELYVVYNRA